MTQRIHVFGIRHHGPGSARSLLAALDDLDPDVVLIEGPPDAEAVLPLVTHAQMQPPVALLVYPRDRPADAVYYPFTHFSPEWQAIRFAAGRQLPVHFMDLPVSHRLKLDDERGAADRELGIDPIGVLATAAGYDDRELWWEQQVEQRRDPAGLFDGIREAMTALRAEVGPPTGVEALREAYMRKTIRTAVRKGHQRIAVVCGAWHAPALAEPGPAKPDNELLRGLAREKVVATWIPWTSSRLSYRSGYGAGIDSPGWYEHLWQASEHAPIRWITMAARLLRERDLDASAANIIEAVRLADALAALRDLAMPGLAELREAIATVLCHGQAAPLELVRERLEVGEKLGQVPDDTPAVPLARDVEQLQRRLRMKPAAAPKMLQLDLRKDTDRERSRLLHRLDVLGIPWGRLVAESGTVGAGTFKEPWQLDWRPEMAIAIIEANIWGTTVESAATARVREAAREAPLPALTALLERTMPAELPGAVDDLLHAIDARAAVSSDVQRLAEALPALARVSRYGDVRATRVEHIAPIVASLFERVSIGLPGACASLDDDAAEAMLATIGSAHEAVGLAGTDEMRAEWREVLTGLTDDEHLHGLIRGRALRLLVEVGAVDESGLVGRARLALSRASSATAAAAWIAGLVRGSGLLLVHQDGIWLALDEWLAGLDGEAFVRALPLLRRSFADFAAPERRAMAGKIAHLAAGGARPRATTVTLDDARAHRVLDVLAHVLGVEPPPRTSEPENRA